MGSLSHALQGLKIQPNDIDITTTRQGAHTIQHLLQLHVTRPITHSQADRVRSHLGELTLHGVTVQIIGNMETTTDNDEWTPLPDDHPHQHIKVARASIPVRTLEQETQTYTRLGRTERVRKLRALNERRAKDQ